MQGRKKMGAWGANLYQDDVALDIKDEYKDNLRRGKTNEEAMQEIIDKYQELLEDEEDRGVFWLALADTQWNLGRLDEQVKEQALEIIELGTDLKRWEINEKLYNKRKEILEKLKEKLLSPQPEEKRMPKYRTYKCEWKNGDVFAYQLKSEYAKEQGLEGRYLIIQKIDEIDWYPCSTIPLVRVKITEGKTIPKTEKEIDELEYIQTGFTSYERRFAGFSALRPLKDQIKGMSFNTDEYGLLPEYMASIVITSKNMTKGKLTYLGNYTNITPPQNEFIPICKDNFPTVLWKNFEERLIEMYFGHNKRNLEVYQKRNIANSKNL